MQWLCNYDLGLTRQPSFLGQRAGRGCVQSTIGEDTSNDYDLEQSPGNLEVSEVHTANSDSSSKQKENDCEQDPLKILEHVKINNTFESPLSTIKGVFKDSKDENLSFNKEELRKVEERLKVVFTEFYQKLHLLKHYR